MLLHIYYIFYGYLIFLYISGLKVFFFFPQEIRFLNDLFKEKL